MDGEILAVVNKVAKKKILHMHHDGALNPNRTDLLSFVEPPFQWFFALCELNHISRYGFKNFMMVIRTLLEVININLNFISKEIALVFSVEMV
jgi:hypothetical protein